MKYLSNEFDTLESCGLTEEQHGKVLIWFANKIWDIRRKEDGHCKSYDPLEIEFQEDGSIIAHSYVFDFKDGGRHHPMKNLEELEDELTGELINLFSNDN